jgi:hypothetical protein
MEAFKKIYRESVFPILFTFLAHLDTVLSWVERIFKIQYQMDATHLNWFDFFVKTAMAIALGLLINRIREIKEEFDDFKEISKMLSLMDVAKRVNSNIPPHEVELKKQLLIDDFTNQYYQALDLYTSVNDHISRKEAKNKLNKYFNIKDEPNSTAK